MLEMLARLKLHEIIDNPHICHNRQSALIKFLCETKAY